MPNERARDSVFKDQIFPHIKELPVGPAVASVKRLQHEEFPVLTAIGMAIRYEGFGVEDWIRRRVSPVGTADLAGVLVRVNFPVVAAQVRDAQVIAEGGPRAEFLRATRPVGFNETGPGLHDRMAELARDPLELADFIMEQAGQWQGERQNPDHKTVQKIILLGGERFKKVYEEVASGQPASELPHSAS